MIAGGPGLCTVGHHEPFSSSARECTGDLGRFYGLDTAYDMGDFTV